MVDAKDKAYLDKHYGQPTCKVGSKPEKAIKEIDMQLEIVRIKNRFDKENKTAKDTGGYRDVQLLVKIKGTDLLLEVQLHIKGIHDLKTKVATSKDADGQTGHERYIAFRNMKEAAELL